VISELKSKCNQEIYICKLFNLVKIPYIILLRFPNNNYYNNNIIILRLVSLVKTIPLTLKESQRVKCPRWSKVVLKWLSKWPKNL